MLSFIPPCPAPDAALGGKGWPPGWGPPWLPPDIEPVTEGPGEPLL